MDAPKIAAMVQQGLVLLKQGKADQAEDQFRRVLLQDGDNADSHHFLGVIAMDRGQRDIAYGHLRRAIQLQPGTARFHNSMGVMHVRSKRFAFAIHQFWQSVALEPDYVDGLKNLASALADIGDYEEATTIAQRAHQLQPDALDIQFNLARSMHRMGRLREAVTRYQNILRADPKFVPARTELGFAHIERDEYEEAAQHLTIAVEEAPRNGRGIHGLGLVYEHEGNLDAAVSTWKRSLEISPGEITVLASLGQSCIQVGRAEEGRSYLNEAIRRGPRMSEAHLGLVMSGKVEADDPQIKRLEMLIGDVGIVGDHRVRMHFALGKCYEDIGQYELAFAQYRAGNELKRGMIDYDHRQTQSSVSSQIAFFTPERFQSLKGRFSSDSEQPVFIVGMPRSGTSLVEQILASHPEVFGAGELPNIEKLVRRMPEFSRELVAFPHCLEQMSASQLQNEAADYAAMLKKLAPDATRVTDKMPKNFFHLGLTALLWPNSKIIWCRRNPLDTCISCYNRFFAKGQPFSWDLGELGHYFSEHERLGRHWRDVLPLNVFEVNYEKMTETPEPVIRSLIEFTGLPWNDQCLRFHETDRRVKTNPFQVRQPIYKTSVSRASRFGPWLGPLKNVLELQQS